MPLLLCQVQRINIHGSQLVITLNQGEQYGNRSCYVRIRVVEIAWSNAIMGTQVDESAPTLAVAVVVAIYDQN
ncbi:MAG: hypothetical protein ACP5HZ_12645, partial [Ferrimicrobium sp.]